MTLLFVVLILVVIGVVGAVAAGVTFGVGRLLGGTTT